MSKDNEMQKREMQIKKNELGMEGEEIRRNKGIQISRIYDEI